MKTKILWLLMMGVTLSGCAAGWVTKQREPYNGGVVRYLDAGMGFIVNARRSNADQKMAEYCEGKGYEILKESYDSSLTSYQIASNSGFSTVTPISSDYLHLYFRCNQ